METVLIVTGGGAGVLHSLSPGTFTITHTTHAFITSA